MDSETDISNAIAQLEMLGIDRQKAIKALSRYNYNVERAADFVFSGNAESDDGDTEMSTSNTIGPTSTNNSGTDWPWAEPSSFDTITTDQPQQTTGAVVDSMNEEQLPIYMVKDYDKKRKSIDTTSVTHDHSSWSVVPFTAKEDTVTPAPTTESNSKPEPTFTHSSLTWWSDPENPSTRAAIADLPIGLRPPSYNYAYSSIIIQALFHVPLFRQAILSYRPTPHAWGAPYNYWKGFGEPVPGYTLKSSQPSRRSSSIRISDPSPTANQYQTNTSTSSQNVIPNIMDLPVDGADNLDQHNTSQQEQEPMELITVTEETTDTPMHKVDELVAMTKENMALAELQKLFAFLGNTKRLYGCVAHFVRATNARAVTSTTDWQVDDKSIEDFLDSIIGEMVAVENASNIEQNGAWKDGNSSSLKSMFLLQAEVENGSEVDIEEIYYLNLGINVGMHSFHDCLDPLIYESYPNEAAIFDGSNGDGDDDDLGSNDSDDFDGTTPYKLTTFLQVPPLLLVTLEDRHDYQQQRMKKVGSFKVEKTIYLDRYLTQNKAKVLEKYRWADQWKQDIRRTKHQILALQHDGGNPALSNGLYMNNDSNDCDPSSLDKCQILETTAKYLGSQLDAMEPTDSNITYINSMRTLQQTLYRVRDDIDNKKKELEQLIMDRQQSLQNLFNDSGLHERPYDLRAVLHTDGLNGTGHYWGYIWVEPNEVNLLEDIPAQGGGWHRFCDAKVEKVTEEDVWGEPTDPFALLYTDRNIPVVTKQEIDAITPPDLLQFVHDDNTAFENEINGEPNDSNNNGGYSGKSSTGGSDGDIHQSMSRLSMNTDHGSVGYNDNNTIPYSRDHDQNQPYGRIPNDTNAVSNTFLDDLGPDQQQFSGTKMAATDIRTDDSKFKERIIKIVDDIRNCRGDDCRLMERFDTFLARVGDEDALTSYYQRIESSILSDNNNNSSSGIEDEEKLDPHFDKTEKSDKEGDSELYTQGIDSEQHKIDTDKFSNALDSITLKNILKIVQDDKSLFLLFELYEQYLSMAQTVTMALLLFADNKFSGALEQILKSYQQHDSWRTQLMLNDSCLWKYGRLGDLGFDDILLKYGKACIKKINIEAYNKACNVAYRNRGLQDGIRIANQAQMVISKSSDPKETFLSDVGGCWLNFAELQSGSLTEDQVELLNTLVMIYLDGPTNTASNSAITTSTTATAYPEGDVMDTISTSQQAINGTLDAMDESVGSAFNKSRLEAEARLADLT